MKDNKKEKAIESQEKRADLPLDEVMKGYFVDYASYVILDRAIPRIEDGLKPVQRRIMHALKEMDDGRYNKVANVVGHAMRYHPHGDASIFEAMVNVGQKKLLIDTQGNWGNIYTGDNAAAARYIEARLTPFAKQVVFNPKVTDWRPSYDGRSKEPEVLPIKFPLLLSQGVEGIAVGLATKILPHNEKELIEGAIKILEGKKVKLYPDFPTGASADVSDYQDGKSGGKVKVRAKIEIVKNNLLKISEIPFGTTTSSLIESIVSASEKNKVKVKKVEDNTAKDVSILIHLPYGEEPESVIKTLYAFTRCEESISVNACVIKGNKPEFLSVTDLLKDSAERTKELLRRELEIKKNELNEKMHLSSLEKIFIENKIYRHIEECESWEEVIKVIDNKLKPFKKSFFREITEDDIVLLTEIKIKRISKFDAKKADELIKSLGEELKEVKNNLSDLTGYTISYYKQLLATYGKEWKRRTQINEFDTVNKTEVAIANQKLYVNRKDGFIGTGLKKEEFVSDCSDMDEVICFMANGTMKVVKAQEKCFVGKDIIHCQVYRRGDEQTVYNLIYLDGKEGKTMVKRFTVPAITREKEYDLTKGTDGSKALYFSVGSVEDKGPELVRVNLKPKPRIKLEFEYNVSENLVKGRDSQGNILSIHTAQKVTKIKK